ncbi:MAG: ABC transporter permease [Meiothermus sp.]|uniref:ABC transporter permease n=1 Tax=Meiothermus sp. TaxID=1955249 RepID=UPI0025DB0B27|nr:ABC transporter permease [Meiothermus sp.]MCS7067954.1 ABC transporter permease [Meiothermus sp.]
MLISSLLNQVLVTGGIFWVISLLSQPTISGLAALFFWQYVSIPLSKISADIWEESTSGAFEQMYLHANHPVFVLIVRLTNYLAQQTVFAVPSFFLMAFLFGFTFDDLAQYNWGGLLLTLIVTLIGFVGLGLAVGGVLLIYRNAIGYTSALEYLLLFMGGTVIPLSQLPSFLQPVAVWLPLSLGVETLRRFETGTGWENTFWLLVVQSAVMLLVGFVLFNVCLSRALQRGFAMSR